MLKCTINIKLAKKTRTCHYEKEHAISRKANVHLLDVIFFLTFSSPFDFQIFKFLTYYIHLQLQFKDMNVVMLFNKKQTFLIYLLCRELDLHVKKACM